MTLNYRDQAEALARDLANQTLPTERAASYMLALGQYRFSVDTAAYQAFTRELSFLWPTQQRFGSMAAPQFVGRGEFKRSLNGVIYPEYKGGLRQVDAMAAQAGLGQPLQLVSGIGEVLGFWCITSIRENATVFHRNGQARKLDFSLELLYYGDRYKGVTGGV
ncbi:phage tail protein [Vibrio parahaemolyticus]|uniref:phage tail protein n=1 Tax=Vibrio parahaemolyticus TaxID=670 RepID=UPI0024935378|nr:phage tail protein [Vibrio parahaemolyticus]